MQGKMVDAVRDNAFLFVIVALGVAILVIGYDPPYAEAMVVLGAAFIIAVSVGIYMMLATRQVAKRLHERFNEQNDILNSHTRILKEIASSQKDMASTLQRIEQSITSSQKEIASSQKEIASSQKDTASTLKNIERILDEKSQTS